MWQVHLIQYFTPARIVTQTLKQWIIQYVVHKTIALLIGPIKPRKGCIYIPAHTVNSSYLVIGPGLILRDEDVQALQSLCIPVQGWQN